VEKNSDCIEATKILSMKWMGHRLHTVRSVSNYSEKMKKKDNEVALGQV
jgi:hypothetical protein